MEIILFGIAKEIVGTPRLSVTEKISTVAELKRWINARYPAMQSIQAYAVAIDSNYATDTDELSGKGEIAIIPPVSGG